MADNPWSREEVEAIVADYAEMLESQLSDRTLNKSQRRRELSPLLNDRSDDSIQFKHRNISAVLVEVGFPYVDGYKPLSNYQGLLAEVVLDKLQSSRALEEIVALDADAVPTVSVPALDELLRAFVSPPAAETGRRRLGEPRQLPYAVTAVRRGVNYLEREAHNRALGLAGEEFVVRLEQARLVHAGQERLAAQIEHVSVSRGDGLGYDILSFEADSRERLIEVKTTKHGRETPFFVSKNEVAVSANEHERYQLYRVFDFRKKARLFALPGSLAYSCELDPYSYRARVA